MNFQKTLESISMYGMYIMYTCRSISRLDQVSDNVRDIYAR